MLPLKNRLKLNRDFDKTFQTGHSYYGRFLGVKIVKNQLDFNRFGFSINLKVDKRAVIRNLLKRKLKGILINIEKDFKKGFDCVIIVLSEIKQASDEEIKNDLINIFKSLNLFKK